MCRSCAFDHAIVCVCVCVRARARVIPGIFIVCLLCELQSKDGCGLREAGD